MKEERQESKVLQRPLTFSKKLFLLSLSLAAQKLQTTTLPLTQSFHKLVIWAALKGDRFWAFG